jgi:hypothetical protein
MINLEAYQHYAADCVRQAEIESEPEDKNILLNMALAWVRLAQQSRSIGEIAEPEAASEPKAGNEPENSELVL